MAEMIKEWMKAVIGMKEVDARKVIESHEGFSARVMQRDGTNLIGTCDYNIQRLNLDITNGLVTSFDLG